MYVFSFVLKCRRSQWGNYTLVWFKLTCAASYLMLHFHGIAHKSNSNTPALMHILADCNLLIRYNLTNDMYRKTVENIPQTSSPGIEPQAVEQPHNSEWAGNYTETITGGYSRKYKYLNWIWGYTVSKTIPSKVMIKIVRKKGRVQHLPDSRLMKATVLAYLLQISGNLNNFHNCGNVD